MKNCLLFQVLYTEKPLVLCAPTGSGKTVVMELAIIRLLNTLGEYAGANFKIVYSKCASTRINLMGLEANTLTIDILDSQYSSQKSKRSIF